MVSVWQHGSPFFVKEGSHPVQLKNARLGELGREDGRREEFLQNLVHDHPEIVPMDEIEPAFTPLVSICKELPTKAGYVDNLWMTPHGGVVLGECKLMRNPQSRREVVAQGLDYARAVAGWHYEDLQNAVRKAWRKPEATIWERVSELVKNYDSLDEPLFVDAVERRLKFGRVMVLIVSDGIHEGAEALAAHLQMHAGAHAGLALLDLSIWQGIDGGILVVPRVPLRTVLVERGIVVVDQAGIRFDKSENATTSSIRASISTGAVPRSMTASEPEFYERFDARYLDLSNQLRQFLASLDEIGIEPDFQKSVFLMWPSPQGPVLSAGCIEPTGSVWFLRSLTDARRLGNEAAGIRYLEAIARIVGGAVKSFDNGSVDVRGPDDRSVRISTLLEAPQRWKDAIETFINEMKSNSEP
jgi:hypothetical protein